MTLEPIIITASVESRLDDERGQVKVAIGTTASIVLFDVGIGSDLELVQGHVDIVLTVL